LIKKVGEWRVQNRVQKIKGGLKNLQIKNIMKNEEKMKISKIIKTVHWKLFFTIGNKILAS